MSSSMSYQPGQPDFGPAAETVLRRAEFAAAAEEITQWEGYDATPLYSLQQLASELGFGALYYKDEGPRFGLGSFKALGGAYAGLRVLQREVARRTGETVALVDIRNGRWAEEVSKITLASATDGNHGRSLAWGAQKFGAACRIYIHAEVSEGRAQAMRDFGAEVIRIDGDYDDSVDRCRSDAEAHGWFVVSDTSWPGYTDPPHDVMTGYGVMTDEIVSQMPEPPTHVLLQGGVGGMAASVAARLRQLWGEQSPRICIVEPNLAPCLFESARLGVATSVTISEETIMAGLSCGVPSPLAWPILQSEASDFVTIDDARVPDAVRRLARPNGEDPAIDAGESGVAGLAALLEAADNAVTCQKLGLDERSRVLLIGSEGVTDPDIFAEIMTAA